MLPGRNGQAGASLLAIIIAVGIMGIAGAILSSNLVSNSRYAKRTDLNVDLQAIKTTVTNFMDCQATVGAKKQCLASTVYQLKMRNGAPLFPNNASSAWIVTGTCKSSAPGKRERSKRDAKSATIEPSQW